MSYWEIGIEELDRGMIYTDKDIPEEDREYIANLAKLNESYAHLEANHFIKKNGKYILDKTKKLDPEIIKMCRSNAIATIKNSSDEKNDNLDYIKFYDNPLLKKEDDGYGIGTKLHKIN